MSARSTSIRLMTVMKAFASCLLLGGAAVGYVWQKRELHELGRSIRLAEQRLEQLQRSNKFDRAELSMLGLPQSLLEQLKTSGIVMMPARPDQLVRLPEPAREGWVTDKGIWREMAGGR